MRRIIARLVACAINGLLTAAIYVVLAPIVLVAKIIFGIGDLGKWAELHGRFDGDEAAYERARTRYR